MWASWSHESTNPWVVSRGWSSWSHRCGPGFSGSREGTLPGRVAPCECALGGCLEMTSAAATASFGAVGRTRGSGFHILSSADRVPAAPVAACCFHLLFPQGKAFSWACRLFVRTLCLCVWRTVDSRSSRSGAAEASLTRNREVAPVPRPRPGG